MRLTVVTIMKDMKLGIMKIRVGYIMKEKVRDFEDNTR